jgi:hypothetical protein
MNTIHRTPALDLAIMEYFDSSIGKEISAFLNKQGIRLDTESFSYRIINHWEKNDLLFNVRPEGKGWRRFSLIDTIWVHIIAKLRGFGFSLEKIKLLKEELKYEPFGDWAILDFYLSRSMALQMPVYLIAFVNGRMELVLYEEYIKALPQVNDHITISLNGIVQEVFPENEIEPSYPMPHFLSEQERLLLFMIQHGDFDSILIKTQNGNNRTV